MDPQLSGFAIGLLLGAAKLGFIGTIGFGIGWWRANRRLRRLAAEPDQAELAERLASLERLSDYTAAQLDRVLEAQSELARSLGLGSSRSPRLEPGPVTPPAL